MKSLSLRMHTVHGFTLLEVMVALLISAISLLGLASLQLSARNSLDASFQYSQASLIAQDLSERMHANPAGVRAGLYSNINTENGSGTLSDCSAGCSPAAIAANDIATWSQSIQNSELLLLGIGQTALNGDRVAITVLWNGQKERFKNRPTTCPPLDCLSIEVPVP
ncbi:MAG: type IV pilus modification protein PilV [Gammaproteobacteria bacterium]|nr:type IV pilus modification protein PilV [Gammaproteobacteria bacterium]